MSYFGRKHRPERKAANEQAWISVEGGFATRQCTLLDVSEGGARLRMDDPEFVRQPFRLKKSLSDPGRSCAIAWRDGNEMGIEFLPSAAPRWP
jgi:hypothetical protein